MMRSMVILANYDDETDSMFYADTVEAMGQDEAKHAFEVAKAYLNSVECNHDQLDRKERCE